MAQAECERDGSDERRQGHASHGAYERHFQQRGKCLSYYAKPVAAFARTRNMVASEEVAAQLPQHSHCCCLHVVAMVLVVSEALALAEFEELFEQAAILSVFWKAAWFASTRAFLHHAKDTDGCCGYALRPLPGYIE